jgi:diguanylate cyclase (GGDEF)-like protein
MQPPSVDVAISQIGITAQLAGCVVLSGFFALLRRYARRRLYFRAWSWAWVALSVAIGAIFLEALLLPALLGSAANDPLIGWAADWLYLFGKLLFAALLVLGTARYVRGLPPAALMRWAVLGAAVYATVCTLITDNLARLVVWQVPVVVLAYAYCALALLLLPRSRRSLGARAAAAGFAGMSILWATYWVAFGQTERTGFLGAVARFNPLADLLLHVVLGLGMVVLLMEDAKREVDDANAELAAAHDELRSASLYDALTGSLNRTAFNEGVGLDVATHTYGAVVVLDLDNLKVVNDTHGHAAGDRLLRGLVQTLRAALRPTDRVYRWGGDEFLVVMPGADAEGVRARVEEVVARAEPVVVNGWSEPIPLLASVGVADYPAAERLPFAIERADDAMYEEKKRRRGRKSLATPVPLEAE